VHYLLVTDIVKARSSFEVFPALIAGAVLLAAPLRAEFVYVSNAFDKTVSGYSVGSDGNLTPVPDSPFATGADPSSVAFYPAGNFLYVANEAGKSVSGYSVSSTGALTPVPGSPFTVGSQIVLSLTVDAKGGFVFVTGQLNGVYAFSIGSNGALTSVSGSPFKTRSQPFAVTADPKARFAYVANADSADVSGYRIAFDRNPYESFRISVCDGEEAGFRCRGSHG
jgi:6-phosphogluconolactonase (cycloisomerase 2 family)